ncbi:site-specific integrase [Sporosarcina sp. YIM B06819]|uniref:site-specific integrase n=1 Tax=Sporosarcina sp. YIM B06819 TaxID=3081769 RepID=UPI00298C838C|nr:site-specific integrase [Sporosarcina sp. YIM B06819]
MSKMSKIDKTIKAYTKKNGEIRYMFRIYVGVDPLTGKEQRTTLRGFKTPKEADLALSRIKIEISEGTFRKQRVETYEDIYNLWIKQYEKDVEESTFVKTTGLFKNHILPAMGAYRIEKMHVRVCQKHVDEWAVKLKRFRMVKSYAAKVLDFAINHGYIQTNPFTGVNMPANASKKIIENDEYEAENFYSREQLKEFLSCLEQESNYKAYAFFRLLSYSGIRKGEALALTWDDLDFKTNQIRISKAISRGKNNQLYLKLPKTRRSRIIKMDGRTMDILKVWKKKQKQDYLILGFNTSQPKQLVFSNELNEYIQPTKTRKWILHVQEKYKLDKITTHGLRHTHCTLSIESGANLKEVQDRLGHNDIKTTMNIYAHVTEEAQEGAMLKFADYIGM